MKIEDVFQKKYIELNFFNKFMNILIY
jgi:hypothetical protein